LGSFVIVFQVVIGFAAIYWGQSRVLGTEGER
jgi:hypothetical protein